MSELPGPNRRDIVAWGGGIVVAAVATVISSASGARLGVALTAGVIALVIVVLAALATERH